MEAEVKNDSIINEQKKDFALNKANETKKRVCLNVVKLNICNKCNLFLFFFLIKFIKARIEYPENLYSVVGEHYEIVFKSEFLLFSSANRDDVYLWGTNIYSTNSDFLKGI